MRYPIPHTVVSSLMLLAASVAYGQSRCDCSDIIDSCRAQITEVPIKGPGARFLVKADTEQCAIVEFSIDGMHGQTTVWDDGDEIDNVSARKPGGKLSIRSCRVCKDGWKAREGGDARVSVDSLGRDSRCARKLVEQGAAIICAANTEHVTVFCKSNGVATNFTYPRMPTSNISVIQRGDDAKKWAEENKGAIEESKAYFSQTKEINSAAEAAVANCR